MKAITLNFQSPSSLNKSKEVVKSNSHLWVHADFKGFDNGVLQLDIDTWEISCPELNISGHLNRWMVDEKNYTMKLDSEDIEGDFAKLNYTFAVSMLGQVLSPNKLLEYLKALQEVYKIASAISGNQKPNNLKKLK